MQITTRRDAVEAGAKYFFTGRPCKYGHITQRYVGNGACVECLRPTPTSPGTAMVLSTPGEIISPIERSVSPERLELQRSRVEIERQKIMLKAQSQEIALRKLELSTQQRDSRVRVQEANLALRLEGRRQRQERQERAGVVKADLVPINLLIQLEDYERVVTMVWAAAVAREPRLRREDVVIGPRDKVYVMKCFPEDRTALLAVLDRLYFEKERRYYPGFVQLFAETQQRLAAHVQKELQLLEDNGQPEGDPR